jgi:hypothetical protein
MILPIPSIAEVPSAGVSAAPVQRGDFVCVDVLVNPRLA